MARSAPVDPPAKPLSDGVVTLRLRRQTDADAIASASHDDATRRWLDDPPMDATAQATSMRRAREAWRSGRAARFVIADATTDAPIGLVNLQFRSDEAAAVAYSVFPASRGRGIASRAVCLVAAWAMADLGVTELLLEADSGNAASIRVAEKCGFERTGSREERSADGACHETIVFTHPR